MARALRIEYEGDVYHVTARGNEERKIFFSSSRRDYDKFKECLGEVKEKYRLLLNAYVLMSNHYHLVVETPQKNLRLKKHTGASNGEIGETFGKLTFSALAKISQSFSKRMEHDKELRKRVATIVAEYLGVARISF